MLAPECSQIAYLEFQKLDLDEIRSRLIGSICFISTRYLAARSGSRAWIFRVIKRKLSSNLARISNLIPIADPENVQLIQDPDLDVFQPDSISDLYLERRKPILVIGKYGHVRFWLDLTPLQIHILDPVPPESRLYHMALKLSSALGLNFRFKLLPISIPGICSQARNPEVMIPCDISLEVPCKRIHILDKLPRIQNPSALSLVGCTLSLEIFREAYGSDPGEFIQFCPLQIPKPSPFLVRCCKLSSIKRSQDGIALPWKFRPEQLVRALKQLNKT